MGVMQIDNNTNADLQRGQGGIPGALTLNTPQHQ